MSNPVCHCFDQHRPVLSKADVLGRLGGVVNGKNVISVNPWIRNFALSLKTAQGLFSQLVAVNKMVCHFWHQFLTQFSLLFQMVPFFFLSMAALRTTNTKLSDWLLELFQPIRLWLSRLPCGAKWMVPSERAMKTESETGVKSDTPFCWGLSLRKTSSVCG